MKNICNTCGECTHIGTDKRFLNSLGESYEQFYCSNDKSPMAFDNITMQMGACSEAEAKSLEGFYLPRIISTHMHTVFQDIRGMCHGSITFEQGCFLAILFKEPVTLENLEHAVYSDHYAVDEYELAVIWLRNTFNNLYILRKQKETE